MQKFRRVEYCCEWRDAPPSVLRQAAAESVPAPFRIYLRSALPWVGKYPLVATVAIPRRLTCFRHFPINLAKQKGMLCIRTLRKAGISGHSCTYHFPYCVSTFIGDFVGSFLTIFFIFLSYFECKRWDFSSWKYGLNRQTVWSDSEVTHKALNQNATTNPTLLPLARLQ